MRISPLIVALLLALPAPAFASAVDLNLSLGAANPAGDRVNVGPLLGVGAAWRMWPWALTVGAEQTLHTLAADSHKVIDATTGTIGFEVGIDDLPVIPVLGVGGALQYASRRDIKATALVPAGYLSAGLLAGWEHLQLGAQVRYLTAGFSADGFPSFTTFTLQVGWRL